MKTLNLEENNNINLNNNNLKKNQETAISNIFNKVINWAIDTGIRYFLPNSIEDEVIKIKDNLLNGNIKNKINQSIENIINNDKNKLNNKQEIKNINDLEKILKNPDTIKMLTETVEKILDNKNLNINSEKLNNNLIIKNIENSLDTELQKQINSLNKLETYSQEWKKYYGIKDFQLMNNTYKNIKKELKNIVPLENIIKECRRIENLNELIKSKGGDFNITKEELELANRLI